MLELTIRNNQYFLIDNNDENTNHKTECRIDTQIMKLEDMRNKNGKSFTNKDLNIGIVHDVFGNIWEGTVHNNHPFGYGIIRNRNNRVIYEGFYCNILRIPIKGEENANEEWDGAFFENKRCILHFNNGKEEVVIDTESDYFNADGLSSWSIQFGIEKVIVDNDFQINNNNVRIENYNNLKEVKIGDSCFLDVNSFHINNCCQLKRIYIGKESFSKDMNEGSFLVEGCEELEELVIGNKSFMYYNNELILSGIKYTDLL